MDWQVKSVSRTSHVTGAAFQPGQEIVSFLVKRGGGELDRVDMLGPEADAFQTEGTVLGWWCQPAKDRASEADADRAALHTSEGLFRSLYREGGEESPERDLLKYLLALMLERKRLMRALPLPDGEVVQRYRMRKSGEEFEVPLVDILPDQLLKIQDQLSAVGIAG